MKNKHIIGVIGGMGPYASAEFYRLLIQGARHTYGARNNDEYPEIVIDSVPVPDFLSDTKKMDEAADILIDRTRKLEMFGATIFTMACNTACILRDRLMKATLKPFLFVVDEVVQAVSLNQKKVLLLASPSSLRFGLYQTALINRGIEYVVPEEKDFGVLEYCIRSVIEDRKRGPLMRTLVRLSYRYIDKSDIDGVVLGCTELPLIFPADFRLPAYNSLSILAESILKQYYYGRRII